MELLPWWLNLLIALATVSIVGEIFKYLMRRKSWRIRHMETGEMMPGPMTPLPSITDWWGMIKFFFGHFNFLIDIHGYWEWLVKKHGSLCMIYILTQPVVVVAEPELVNQVMVVDWKSFRRPVEFFDCLALMRPALKGALPRAEGEDWNVLHRIMQPGFKYGYLKRMVPTVQRYADELCEKLRPLAEKHEIMYANKEMSMMALDVIGRVAFGFDLKAMQGSGLVTHAERFMQEMTNAFAYIPYWHILPTPGNNSMRKAMEVMTAKAREVLSVRRKKEAEGKDEEGYPDLLQVLLQPDHISGHYLDDDTVVANSIFFMVAGHESTSTAMSWTLYLLSHHPEIQKKGQAEVDELLKGVENPTLDDYMKLKYVEMIIKEGLRLYPPAPFNVRMADEDTTLGGYFIPKDTFVFMPVKEIQRLESAWPNPNAFEPERWLQEKAMKKGSFLPFNIGHHNCIGQKFAMLEMRVVMSMILKHYDILPVESFKPQLTMHFMSPKKSIEVYIKKRAVKN